jgi:hypothetical protein
MTKNIPCIPCIPCTSTKGGLSLSDNDQPLTVRLTLRALPGPVPPWLRVRRLLKFALRACGLKNIGLEEVTDQKQTPAPPAGRKDDPCETT